MFKFEREERIRLLVKESTRDKLKVLARYHDSTMLLVLEKLINEAYDEATKGGENG